MIMELTAAAIADFLGGYVEGDPTVMLHDVAKIEEGHEGALSFLSNPKYERYLYSTGSSAVLVNKEFEPTEPVHTTLIRVDDSYGALAKLLTMVSSQSSQREGISDKAVIDPSVRIGEHVYIGPYAVLEADSVVGDYAQVHAHSYVGMRVSIGEHSCVYPHVTLYADTELGSHVIIHSGAVIGADGFGFAPQADGSYQKIPQMGNVVIGNHVEIGANTTVDRASLGVTRIGDGVKLDNLIQVAHNVVIGDHTVIAAQSGIAGSSKVGKHCLFGGQVGLVGHIEIADRVQLGAQSGVSHSVKMPGATMMGSPAIPIRVFYKSAAHYKRLHELNKEVDALKRQVEALTNEAEHKAGE